MVPLQGEQTPSVSYLVALSSPTNPHPFASLLILSIQRTQKCSGKDTSGLALHITGLHRKNSVGRGASYLVLL